MTTLSKGIRRGRAQVLAITNEPAAYWLLAAILVISFALYVYFVTDTVKNVVKRQNLESEISTLNSEIGDLEFKDISMKNDVTLDKALAMGFKEVETTKYITRTAGQVAMNGSI